MYLILYHVGMVTILLPQSFYKDYYIYIYKSGDQLVNKWTDNDTDHFVATFLNPIPIMLDAFNNLLCSRLCWHNRPGPMAINIRD